MNTSEQIIENTWKKILAKFMSVHGPVPLSRIHDVGKIIKFAVCEMAGKCTGTEGAQPWPGQMHDDATADATADEWKG